MNLRLRHLLLVSVSLLLFFSIFLVVLVGQHLQFSALEEQSGQRTEVAAEQAARRLEFGIHERYLDLDIIVRRLAEESGLHRDNAQALFDRIQQSYPGYAWLGMADAEGRIVAASQGHLLNADVSRRPWFEHGLRGAYLSDVHPSLLLADLLPKANDGLPPRLLDIAVPIVRNGKVDGVLAAHLNWDWVSSLLGEFEQNPLPGVRREVLLLDLNRLVVRGPTGVQGRVLSEMPDMPGGEASARYWSDGDWFNAAVLTGKHRDFAHPGWIMLVRESRADLFGLGDRLRQRFWLAVVPILLFFLLAIGVLGRYLARPVEAISEAARRHEAIPDVSGWAEVRELRGSLSLMMERLLQQKDLVEAEVRERIAEYQHLLSALNNHTLVTMADSEGNITYCNDLFCKVSGYTRREAIGQNHRLLKSNVHPEEFFQEMWRTLLAGRIWSGIIANRHKNGSLYWVKSVIVPGSTEPGSPHAYISVRTDISELMEMQEAQNRLNRDLLRQGTLLTLLSKTTATANEAFDRQDALQRCLREICCFMGWSIGHAYELIEPPEEEPYLRSLDIWYVEDSEKYRAFIERSRILDYRSGQGLPGLVLQQKGPVFTWLSQWSEKTSRRHREALAADFNSGLAIPVFAGENILGVIEFFSDRGTEVDDEFLDTLRNVGLQLGFVFRRHDQAALLNQAVSEANRANQAKSDFLSSMSHELRTPLNVIIGFAQMLELDSELNADQHDNVGEILHAGRHLLELINEVLDLAKIESGRLELSLEPVSVSGLVADCIQLTAPLALKREIEIEFSGTDGVMVRGDPLRLKQVLLNLLSNAIKYNRDGGKVRILGVATAEAVYRVSVEDTGLGIPEERLAELFQPFRRLVGANSKIEGTGIGLTICKRLVEEMHGRIGVQSLPGQGSTFWFEVPMLDAAGVAATEAPHGGFPALPGHPSSVRLYVLCIDDNPANLKLLQHLLARHPGVRVATALTPGEGLELAMAECPDLVLLDINMPDMDGYQVLRILRANASTARTHVVAATANALSGDVARGLEAGFDGYLTKPLDIQKVDVLIHTLSERKSSGPG